jgi:hypothetical protein
MADLPTHEQFNQEMEKFFSLVTVNGDDIPPHQVRAIVKFIQDRVDPLIDAAERYYKIVDKVRMNEAIDGVHTNGSNNW